MAQPLESHGKTELITLRKANPMKNKSAQMGAVFLVLLAILLSVRFFADKKSEDFPDGLSLVCQNCRHAFMLSHKKFIKLYSEQQDASAFPCPNCRQRTAVRSITCDECGQPFATSPLMEQGAICPDCKSKNEAPETRRSTE